MLSSMSRASRVPRLLLAAALLAGCSSPPLHPLDPPPNIPAGLALLDVPAGLVAALSEETTLRLREDTLRAVAEGRHTLSGPGVAEAVAAHRIETGMTVEEVILAVGSHPTRVRDQGAPGGHTLLWEPSGLLAAQRFWVRFGNDGRVWAAGWH